MRGRSRLWGAALAACLLLAVAGSALAAPAPLFQDVQGRWSEKDVARMQAKGVVAGDQGKYRPLDPVTGQEALAMLIRVLGKEGQTAGQTLPAGYPNLEAASPWAKGVIALAVREGLIAGNELGTFRPQDRSRRADVAVMVGRAMGLTPQAGAVLSYADARDVPAAAVGYVAALQREGIMSGGSDNRFRPLDSISREEMAAILNRVDARLNRLVAGSVRGEVFSVSHLTGDLVLVTSDGTTRTFKMAAGSPAYRGGLRTALSALQRGEKLEAVLRDNEVAYLEVIPEERFAFDEVEVSGTIAAISAQGLTLERSQGLSVAYRFGAGGPTVLVGNTPASLSSLAAGQAVTLTVQGPVVKKVVLAAGEVTVKGTVSAATAGSLTVAVSGGGSASFTLDSQTQVLLDYRTATAADLYPGQAVEVTASGGRAEKVLATSVEEEASGSVVSTSFAPRETLRVRLGDGREKDYPLAEGARLRRGSATITLRDVLPGDRVDLELRNGKVERLYASTEESELVGRVQAVTLATTSRLTVLVDGEAREFTVAPDAEITRRGSRVQLKDVQVGDQVELTLRGQQVVKARVTARTSQDYLIGVVENVNQTARVLVIRDTGGNLQQVYLNSSYTIIRFGDEVSLRSVQVDDEVIAVGRVESGVFMASTVVVVAAVEE